MQAGRDWRSEQSELGRPPTRRETRRAKLGDRAAVEPRRPSRRGGASATAARRMPATFMPNFSRLLPPARAAITLMVSRFGVFSMMRSLCQMESTPPLSHRLTHSQKPLPSSKVKFAIPIPAPMVMMFSAALPKTRVGQLISSTGLV